MSENPYEPPQELIEDVASVLTAPPDLLTWGAIGFVVGTVVGISLAVIMDAYNPRGAGLGKALFFMTLSAAIAGASGAVLVRSMW